MNSIIKKFELVHGNKYDYSLVDYITVHKKVTIICPTHGKFEQSPNNHRKGMGCPECGKTKSKNSNELNENRKDKNSTFIDKANKIHGNKYDYSLVNYQKFKNKVKIVCLTHGVFEQSPTYHLQGQGCPECGRVNSNMSLLGSSSSPKSKNNVVNLLAKNNFINKANILHNSKYTYHNSMYINNHTKVIITCPVHGNFIQLPSDHLAGKGCKSCGIIQTKAELELVNWFNGLGVTTVHHYKDKYEIDILLPEYNIGIEYNGLHWHSELYKDKNYHYNKSKHFKSQGIRIIHIWEDEYNNNKDKVLSYLMYQLGLINNRTYARKCCMKQITSKNSNEFYDMHHLLGKTLAKYHLGLFNACDKLVAVASFSNNGSMRGETHWELIRYASIGSVVGGLSKLMSNFVKTYEINTPVYSYTDNDKFTGNSYLNAGFELVEELKPDYKTFSKREYWRHAKQHTRRNNLNKILNNFDADKTEHQNCIDNGIYRVYDSGKMKWVYSAHVEKTVNL
jgi:very-short-patch-repair endonuclease